MAGLSLSTSTDYFLHDDFESWDPATNTFLPGLQGRFHRADRFKTIYHRPTRRHKISLTGDTALPASGVIRHTKTQEVFLTSVLEEEEIWQGQEVYERLVTLHRAVPFSGGYAQFHPVTVAGSGDNLGEVSYAAFDPAYIEIELRTASDEKDSLDVSIGDFNCHLSRNITPDPGDYFLFNGTYYRVAIPYSDSGFRAARLVKEEPHYETLTYKLDTGTSGYDPVTGTFSAGTADRLVSAIFGDAETMRDRTSGAYNRVISAFVYQRHIGFTPKVGDKVVHNGQEYEILKVAENQRELQWRLEIGL